MSASKYGMTFDSVFQSPQVVERIILEPTDVERDDIILGFPANDCITAISHEICA